MTLVSDINSLDLVNLLDRYGIKLVLLDNNSDIPGSFWGEPEAGIINNHLYVRNDTPIHSAFHEACHYICMDTPRRQNLHTNCGGDFDEENAVCYLQILLASQLTGFSRQQMLSDMDAWGYSFRLGSAEAWFLNDAQDACSWLITNNLVTKNEKPTWNIRH